MLFGVTVLLYFSFSMILFLNRNDEKWPHTRQIKIAGRNHILPPLGIAWKTKIISCAPSWIVFYLIGDFSDVKRRVSHIKLNL
jgi:hypothetical protein